MAECRTSPCGRRYQRKFGREKLVIEKRGKLLACAVRGGPPPPAREKIRGTIRGFSKASRMRLLKMVATIDWGMIPCSLFITLTYPDECQWDDPDERNKQRYLFHRNAEKHLGREVCGIWRTEWLPRKSGDCIGMIAPHHHALFLGVGFIPQEKIKLWWKAAIGSIRTVSIKVKGCRSAKKAALYVSKYCAKVPDEYYLDNGAYLNNQGRHWGYFRRPLIPRENQEIIDNLTPDEWEWLTSRANGLLRWRLPEDDNGFCVLGNMADYIWTEFLTLRLDGRIE